jgi:hypothetical protein
MNSPDPYELKDIHDLDAVEKRVTQLCEKTIAHQRSTGDGMVSSDLMSTWASRRELANQLLDAFGNVPESASNDHVRAMQLAESLINGDPINIKSRPIGDRIRQLRQEADKLWHGE